MRVLISAYACSPFRGSEYAVGWNVCKELAQHVDVEVICGDVSDKQEANLDFAKFISNDSLPKRLKIHYVAPSKVIKIIERLHRLPGCWGLYYLAYNLWQRAAYRLAKKLVKERSFDVVHQLNMIGYREPGYMWKLGLPFVWGPVGGAPNEPLAYHSLFSWSGCVKVFLRTVCNEIQKRTCWRARRAAKCAKKIWAVTDADYKMIHDIWGVECARMIEAGVDETITGTVRSWDGKGPLRIAWSGIHTSRKALPILILALKDFLSRVEHEERVEKKVVVDVLGEGPETGTWKRLAEKAGVADCLIWHGKLPRADALEIMQQAHILACPSIKEASSIVVIEAISMGLPVICHDACGMGIVVTDKCGIKIPLNTPAVSVKGFANAIESVLYGHVDLSKLSQGALQRAKELTWEEKAKIISEAYKEIVG